MRKFLCLLLLTKNLLLVITFFFNLFHELSNRSRHPTGGYDQFGCLSGTFEASDSYSVDISLPGVRARRWGPHKASYMHRTASFVGVFGDGRIFLVEANSALHALTQYVVI